MQCASNFNNKLNYIWRSQVYIIENYKLNVFAPFKLILKNRFRLKLFQKHYQYCFRLYLLLITFCGVNGLL